MKQSKNTLIIGLLGLSAGFVSAQDSALRFGLNTVDTVGTLLGITQTTSDITGSWGLTSITPAPGSSNPNLSVGSANSGRLTFTAETDPRSFIGGHSIAGQVTFGNDLQPEQIFFRNLYQQWEDRLDDNGDQVNSSVTINLQGSVWDQSVLGSTGSTAEGLTYNISGSRLEIINDTGANILGNGGAGPFTEFASVGNVSGFTFVADDILQNHGIQVFVGPAVPEPTSALLLSIASLGLLRRRR